MPWVEADDVAATESAAPERDGVEYGGDGGDFVGAEDEGDDDLDCIKKLVHRDEEKQRQGSGDDGVVVGVGVEDPHAGEPNEDAHGDGAASGEVEAGVADCFCVL